MRALIATALAALLTAAPVQADEADEAGGADGAPALYELVDAAAERLQTADAVAASKWISGGQITDLPRVAQVLAAVTVQSESVGLPSEFVTGVFTDQIDATEAIQYSRFADWKLDPAAAPTAAPDLSASRTLIDGLNRRMVTAIAEDWPVLHAPGCSAALDAAKSGVADRRGLDLLHRQALDAATRSYCGG